MARIGKAGSEGGRHDWENQIKFLLNAVMQLRSEVEQLKNVAFGAQDDKPIHQPTLQLESKSLVPHYESPDLTDTRVPTVHIPDYDDAEDVTEEETLNIEEMEKRMIVRALQKSHNRRKVAAQLLGISERTLYRKINDYGIEE